MTVSSTTRRAGPYAGNDVATAFPFSFKVFEEGDIQPVLTDSDGVATNLTLDSDYSVLLNADQDANPGGTVTYPILVGPAPLPTGSTLTIIGSMAMDQRTDITNSGRFLPQVFEDAYDKLTILVQQLKEISDRTLQAAVGTTVKLLFPAPSSGKFLRWNSANTGLENVDAGTDSMALQGLLADNAVASHGAGMVGFSAAANYLFGTIGHKLRERLSVIDYGAVGNPTDDTTAFTNAIAATADDGTIVVPPGRYNISALASTKKLIWEAEGAFAPDGVTPLSLPGVVKQARGGASNGRLETMLLVGSTGTDFAVEHVQRNATHTGGAVGYVNSGFRVDSYVNAGVTNFEWAIVGRVVNSATAGENVGVYGQGIKQSTGPTWGVVAEAIDSTGTPNPTTGLVGLEVDIGANGTDSNFNRIGIDIVTRRYNPVGATSEGGIGLRIGSAGSLVSGNWKTAIKIADTVTVGIDMSNTSFTAGGYAIRLKTNAPIDFSGDGLQQLFWNGSSLVYGASGVPKMSVNASGDLSVAQTLTLRGNVIFHGSYGAGAQTATLGSNKPGTGGGPPSTWLSFFINGTQHWVPAWTD